jgi:hypothetical protein
VSESDGVLVAASIRNASMALEAGHYVAPRLRLPELRRCKPDGQLNLDMLKDPESSYVVRNYDNGGHCWYFGGRLTVLTEFGLKARVAKLGADFIRSWALAGTPNTKAWLPAFTRGKRFPQSVMVSAWS